MGIVITSNSEMRADFLATFFGSQNGVARQDDGAAEAALQVCQDFYATLTNAPPVDTIYNEFLAAGGQSNIYRCGTTDATTEPAVTASKIFYSVEDKNMTEIEIINRATAEAEIRAPVYYFHETGFIEQFLAGKVDLWQAQTLNATDRAIWTNLAQRLGRMHSLELDNIDQEKYLRGIEGWWNTRQIHEHFETMNFVMSSNLFMNGFTQEVFLRDINITQSELNEEIDWVAEIMHGFYGDVETPVLCHNDLHLGNMMIDEDDTTGDSLILIDFDNTRYGYRAFDFVYHFGYQSVSTETDMWIPNGDTYYYPNQTVIDEFLSIYSASYDGPLDTSLETLSAEVRAHTPYVLLEQIVFLYAVSGNSLRGLKCEYERFAETYGRESAIKCPDLQNSSTTKAAASTLATLFMILVQ